ncbi:MAG TPA: carboxypeptidase regulatory-like domain-containing protein [Vicinamibacterales bacterium]|nr:carboxypeptidase regulatory-like domain-containing protein [Vicinamibacterales bacterium]
MTSRPIGNVIFAFAWLALTPAAAFAQSAFAGAVKDTSGAVLPGVTVEASSPALIEGTRSVVTDGSGQYKIVDLRPGIYTVTFTMPGFKTIKRTGIELQTNVTAPESAELEVGSLEESITVTAQTPTVDVQNAVQQQVLPQRVLDAVPMGGRNIQSVGAILVGITQSTPDVGGTQGMQQTTLLGHGTDGRDNAIMVDGIRLNGIESDGGVQQYYNEGMFAEMSYQTGGIAAETSSGGVRLNMIPKDGGNVLKGDLFYSYSNSHLQNNVLPPDLVAKGLLAGSSLHSIHDLNVSAGGPLLVNKLWLFGSVRHWGVNNFQANSFYPVANASQVTSFTPDTSKQVIDNNLIKSFMARLTYQVDSKNKVSYYLDRIIKFRGHEQQTTPGVSGAQWAEDAFSSRLPKIYYMSEAKWTATWTNKLLFATGIGINNESYTTGELQPGLEACVAALTCDPINKGDLTTGQVWGAPSAPYYRRLPVRETGIASLSYVTGSHAFKTGMELSRGSNTIQQVFQAPGVNFDERFSSGAGNSVVIYNTPTDEHDKLNADLGIYAQDTWTLKRLTVTPGMRWEYFKASYSEQGVPIANQTLLLKEGYPARPLFPQQNMPIWKNWSPRFGAAYDLFGDGKTAIKGSVNKYMVAYSTVSFQVYNPMGISQDTRTWLDPTATGNVFIPGVSQLGPSTNALFGQIFRCPAGTNVTIPGFGQPCASLPEVQRPYNVEANVSIQRELRQGVSVTFGYFRRSYYNQIASVNPALQDLKTGAMVPGAFTPITIPNPCVTTFTNCGGSAPATITIYSINPALIGKGYVIDTNSSTDTRVAQGYEGTFSARLADGQLFGGFSTGKQVYNNCQTLGSASTALTFVQASNPNFATQFCNQNLYPDPFRTQIKLGGSYPLPAAFNVSGTFQSYPGGQGSTTRSYLDVNLSATPRNTPGLNQPSESIPLILPNGKFLPRWNQLDLRLARKFKLAKGDWQVQFDMFNALNGHAVIAQSTTVGSALNTPTQVLQSRLMELGVQLHF